MALSSANITQLVKILKIPRLTLNEHLLNYPLNADDQTEIEAQITLFSGYADDQVKIEPTESNFGSRTNAGSNRKEIAANIVALMDLPKGSAGSNRLQRM